MKEINALKNLQLHILGGKKQAGSGISGLLFGSVLHRTLNLFSLKTVNNRIILNRLKTSAKTTELPVIKIVVKNGQPKENNLQSAKAMANPKRPDLASPRVSPKTSPVEMKSIKEIINVDGPADENVQRGINTDNIQTDDHSEAADKAQLRNKPQTHAPLASVQKEITPQEQVTSTRSNLPEQSFDKNNGKQFTFDSSKKSTKEKIHNQPHHARSDKVADPKAVIKHAQPDIKPVKEQAGVLKPESELQPLNKNRATQNIRTNPKQETMPAVQNKVPPAPRTKTTDKQDLNIKESASGRNSGNKSQTNTTPAENTRIKTEVNQQPQQEISKRGIESKTGQAEIKNQTRQSSAEIPSLKNSLKSKAITEKPSSNVHTPTKTREGISEKTQPLARAQSSPKSDQKPTVTIKNEKGLKTVQANLQSAVKQEKNHAAENTVTRISQKKKNIPEAPEKVIKTNFKAIHQQQKTSQPLHQAAKAPKLNVHRSQSNGEAPAKQPEILIKQSGYDKKSHEPLIKTSGRLENEAVLSTKGVHKKIEQHSAQKRPVNGMNDVKLPDKTGSEKETIIRVEKHVKQVKTEAVVKDRIMSEVKSETPMKKASEKAVRANSDERQISENSVKKESAIDKGQKGQITERPGQSSAPEKTTIKATHKPHPEMKSMPGKKDPEPALKQFHGREVRPGVSVPPGKDTRQVSQDMSSNSKTEGADETKQMTDTIKEKPPENSKITADKKMVSEYKNSGTDQEKIAEDKNYVREDEKSLRRTNNGNKNSIGPDKNVRQNPGDNEKKVSTTHKIDSDPKPDNTRSGISTLNPDEKQVKMNSDHSRNQNHPADKVHATPPGSKTHAETENQFNGQFSRHERESHESTASEKRDTQAGGILRNGQTVENMGKAANDLLPSRFTQLVDHIREAYQLKQQGRVLNQEQTTFRIERGPLGKMDINFQNEKGASKVTIVVESEIAKTELLKYVPIIQQNLQEKGVDITSLFINVNNFNDKEQQDKTFQSKTMHSEQNTGKEDYEESIAHPESNRNYGYNTMEVIA